MQNYNDEIYLEYEEQESSKIKRYDIISYIVAKPIDSIIKWKQKGKLIIPDFQREFVWKYNTSCKLIDSILLNLPIPGLFVCKRIIDGQEKYFLIDGLQRVTTIEQFFNGKYESLEHKEEKEFKICLKNSEWFNKTYYTIEENDRQNFLDYDLSLTVFEIPEKNESKNLNSMYEIFERINTGSEKLTPQEIRNAIFPGEALTEIKDVCQNNVSFKKLIAKDNSYNKRKKDQELLLRFLSYYYIYKLYKENKNTLFEESDIVITTSKIETLNNFLFYSNSKKIIYKNYLQSIIEALDVISMFDEEAFYSISREKNVVSNKVQEVFSEALIIALIENDFNIKILKKDFIDKKIEIWNSEELYKKFTEKTTSKNAILDRVQFMIGILNND